MELNLLIAMAGILGSGMSAYVGVRVALAEVRSDIKHLQKTVEGQDERIVRLESPFFDRRKE